MYSHRSCLDPTAVRATQRGTARRRKELTIFGSISSRAAIESWRENMGVCTISPSPSSVRPQRQTEGQSKSNRGLDAIPHKKRLLGNPRKSLTRSQLSSAAPTSCARILLIEPTATRSLEPGEVVGPACCLRGSHDGVATVTAAKEERLQLDPNQGGSSGSSSPFQLPPRAPHLDTRMPEATASHQKGGGMTKLGTERNGTE